MTNCTRTMTNIQIQQVHTLVVCKLFRVGTKILFQVTTHLKILIISIFIWVRDQGYGV
jgi:hypothetical protein